jgi:hypothetical protein
MKRIVRIFIFLLIAYVSYNAYQDSQINGKSFTYNFGFQFKKVAVIGINKTKAAINDLKLGLKN